MGGSMAGKNPRTAKLADTDDIDNYLDAFQAVADDAGWESAIWTKKLRPQLTGKARAAVNLLSWEEAMNYDQVKETILSAYGIWAETYRRRFRHVQRSEGETYVQLEVKQNNLLEKWLKRRRECSTSMVINK